MGSSQSYKGRYYVPKNCANQNYSPYNSFEPPYIPPQLPALDAGFSQFNSFDCDPDLCYINIKGYGKYGKCPGRCSRPGFGLPPPMPTYPRSSQGRGCCYPEVTGADYLDGYRVKYKVSSF